MLLEELTPEVAVAVAHQFLENILAQKRGFSEQEWEINLALLGLIDNSIAVRCAEYWRKDEQQFNLMANTANARYRQFTRYAKVLESYLKTLALR